MVAPVRMPEITDEDLSKIPKMHNSHTRKFLNMAILSRRQTVHALMAKGYSQYEAAAILQCSNETICKDVAWLREYYKQQMHQYISEELPLKWNETMTLVMSTIRAISRLAEDPSISIHDKLHCYDLLNDCVEIRRDMLSDPTIIEAALDVVDNIKQRLIELKPSAAAFADTTVADTAAEVTEEGAETKGEKVQPTTQQQEESEHNEHNEEQQKQKTNNSVF